MNKSKKALLAILTCSALFAGAFGLAACDSSSTETGKDNTENVGGDNQNQGGNNQNQGSGNENQGSGNENQGGGNENQGGNEPQAHSHVWSEWELDDTDLLYYNGTATRECTGAGDCDAEDDLITVTVPSVRNSDNYTYDAPVHKTAATCKVEGVDTYTFKHTEKDITISFDVKTGYGAHNFVDNECTVCHKTVTVLTLDTEVTVNATAEESLYSFTATKAGKYEIGYTEGSGAYVVIDANLITSLPYSDTLKAGETISLAISAPRNGAEDEPESATYKIKVVPVTVLEPDYGTEEDEKDPYETPATTTINVGGGKTARVDVSGSGYGIISYTGTTPIVVTYSEHVWGQGIVPHSYTLSGVEAPNVQQSFVVEFGYPKGMIDLTVSSAAGEAFDAEISLLLSEDNPETRYLLTVGVEKSIEGIKYEPTVYTVEIDEEGDYVITFGGDDAIYLGAEVSTRDEDGEMTEVEPNEDGSYHLSKGTCYIGIYSDKVDENMNSVATDGTIKIASAKEPVLTVGEPFTVKGVVIPEGMGDIVPKQYTLELEAGVYQVIIDGQPINLDLMAPVMIGGEYEDGYLVPLDFKKDSENNDLLKFVVVETTGTYFVEAYDNVTFMIVKEPAEDDLTVSVGTKTFASLDATGYTLTFSGLEEGKTYTLTASDPKVLFWVGDDMDVNSATFEYNHMLMNTIDVYADLGEDDDPLTYVAIKLVEVTEDEPEEEGGVTAITVGTAADVNNDGEGSSFYSIEITDPGNYTVSFTGFEATDVAFELGAGIAEDHTYVSNTVDAGDDGTYALEAGTYYISIMSIKPDPSDSTGGLVLPVSGTMTVAKAAE